ncbi:DUF6603 domain-containing protein [Nocardiopsis alba]|uniref:DUF6603 domain-containing protein n=1 Tax=Nocardiopsis alba TaxID=53437 RepID=UPI003D71CDA6
MPFAVRELRSLLDDSHDHVELPRSVFDPDGSPRSPETLLGSPDLRLHDPRFDPARLTVSGTSPERGTAVHIVFESDDEHVTGAEIHAALSDDELDGDLASLVRAGFTEPRIVVASGSSIDGHRERHAVTLSSADHDLRIELTAPVDGSEPFTARDVDPVPLHVLGASLGFVDPPALPEPALSGATTLTAHPGANGVVVTGAGARGRVSLMHGEDGSARLLVVEGDGDWQVLQTDHDLSEGQMREVADRLATVEEAPRLSRTERLSEGCWLSASMEPGAAVEVLPLRAYAPRPVAPERRDGLGRALPEKTPERRSRARLRADRARRHVVAGREGFLVVARGGRGSRRLGMSGRTVTPLGFKPGYSDGIVSIAYSRPPLNIAGALTMRDIDDPAYKRIFGGAVTVDAKTLAGSGAAAFFEPKEGAEPSFFAYGAVNARKAIGPPPFQIRGITAGMGWNSRIRTPADAGEVPGFPLVQALNDPGAIGATKGDPVAILKNLTAEGAWITPAEDELWIAAGMAFSSFELLKGEAVLVLQAGSELSLALLGRGGMAFPAESERKIASIELAAGAVFKPVKGELSMSYQLTPNSYVLDPNCKVSGGGALAVWFGDHPNAGDFVYTVGGYHRKYENDLPAHYPRVPRLSLDWGLGSKVSITGQSYFALTSGAAMAGGLLAVRFHAGPVKAWLDAWLDALVQWKPFHFDVGIGVYIGVQASVKVLFVRVTITVEVGADINVWGPPTGGKAKIKLWFVSFTIDFGASRAGGPSTVDWKGFQEMLPPPENIGRIIAGHGLISEQRDDEATEERGPAWQVSAAGFTFRTDSALPVRELYLDKEDAPAHSSDPLRIRPMDRSNLTSMNRVRLEWDGDDPLLLAEWEDSALRGAMPAALYGTGSGSTLPAPGEQVVDGLTGIELTSPPVAHGTTTGYIDEGALKQHALDPDGPQPLDPEAEPTGPIPVHRDGTAATIRDTVASATRAERDALADALTGLGFDLGARDVELPGYAREAAVAFTREPLLVPTG